jgi:phosphoglycolate phosphatase-like HAD superfamily hydrolase
MQRPGKRISCMVVCGALALACATPPSQSPPIAPEPASPAATAEPRASVAPIGSAAAPAPLPAPTDPLPSWTDGATKQAILDFIARVTTPNSAEFVPESERVATFDNDGTLWVEQPVYTQVAFAVDRVRELAPAHPEWKKQEPFKSILSGDLSRALSLGDKAVVELIAATHSGMTTDEFAQIVSHWFSTAKHPKFGKPYAELVYQPMVELMAFLRKNGFKTFIVSGGGIDFMRPITSRFYGIPPEQVVGSTGKYRYQITNGKPEILREPGVSSIDDGPGKPVGIQTHIGQRPLAAFGNSDGDQQMLQWTAAGAGLRLAVLVHHTDGVREVAYDRESKIGKLDKALDEAKAKKWVVISMKDDWKAIFPASPGSGSASGAR